MRLILVTAALALSACNTTATAPISPGATPPAVEVVAPIDRADAAVTRAELAYGRVRDRVDLLLPFLPASIADPIRRARGIADTALGTARTAVDVAQKKAALDELERAVRDLLAATR